MRRMLLVSASALVGVLSWPAPSVARVAKERVALRAEAHEILGTFCGKCHDGSLATAKPKALAIFDLTSPGWADRLTAAQLEGVLGRMESFGVPEASRVRLRVFVAAEKGARP